MTSAKVFKATELYLIKFHSGCKNLDDQARSGWSKSLDFKVAIEANPASSTWEYLVNLTFYSLVLFVTFMTLAKVFEAAELYLTSPKYCKTFDLPLYYLDLAEELDIVSSNLFYRVQSLQLRNKINII